MWASIEIDYTAHIYSIQRDCMTGVTPSGATYLSMSTVVTQTDFYFHTWNMPRQVDFSLKATKCADQTWIQLNTHLTSLDRYVASNQSPIDWTMLLVDQIKFELF